MIYRAIGIPVEMFTVLFAIGRLPGWIAHWVERPNDCDHGGRGVDVDFKPDWVEPSRASHGSAIRSAGSPAHYFVNLALT